PKGAGALWVRGGKPKIVLAPQIHGGGHERGLRSGTLNVPAIVGFGAAAALCAEEMMAEGERLAALRARLERALLAVGGVTLHGDLERRLPNNTNASFAGVSG